jgi:hypothetical protein
MLIPSIVALAEPTFQLFPGFPLLLGRLRSCDWLDRLHWKVRQNWLFCKWVALGSVRVLLGDILGLLWDIHILIFGLKM